MVNQNLIIVLIIFFLAVLPYMILFYFLRFKKENEAERNKELMREALKEKCLDMEVNVISMSDRGTIFLLFAVGLLLLAFMLFLFISRIPSLLDGIDDEDHGILFIVPTMSIYSLILIYGFWPFSRTGRLVISKKLVFLPQWTLRPVPMLPAVLRVENIKRLVVTKSRFGRKRIKLIKFEGSVRGGLKLTSGDYRKYEKVIEYLKDMKMKIIYR